MTLSRVTRPLTLARVTLALSGQRIRLPVPPPGYDAIAVRGRTCTCVDSDTGEPRPLAVRLPHPQDGEDDRSLVGNAVCPWPDCGRTVGRMEVQVDTFFGLSEDRSVLELGRCRVYP